MAGKKQVGELIDEQELSRRTGIAVSTLQKDRSGNDPELFPFIRLGRQIRYDWDACCRRIEEGTVNPATLTPEQEAELAS